MIPPHLDFRRLKQSVNIEQVLTQNGLIDGLRRNGRRLVGPCPLHGGDNPRAFVVNLENNTWYCFTGCGRGGDIVELLRRLGYPDYQDAARYLASLVGDRPARRPIATTAAFRPFTHHLPLNPDSPLLVRKGIDPATARLFEAGTYQGHGFLEGCLGVRLRDRVGRPLGYAGRRLDPGQVRRLGKWKMPPRLPKSRLLYNFHRVGHALSSTLVIVEDPWSVMRLFQLRLPAVALLGTHLSEHQLQLLSGVPTLILMLDGDDAGRKATTRIRHLLSPRATVQVVTLPEGLDPDDLHDEQLRGLTRPFFLP